MNIEFYHVDTFCKDLFSGDPAAVCQLEEWPAEKYLKNIASESYLTKTAFFVREQNHFYIRWFTPEAEVDLCGHATLAAAHVIFHHPKRSADFIEFNSRSGRLGVRLEGELLIMDLPTNKVTPVEVRAEMSNWFSAMLVEAFEGRNVCLLVFANEGDVMRLKPNLSPGESLLPQKATRPILFRDILPRRSAFPKPMPADRRMPSLPASGQRG